MVLKRKGLLAVPVTLMAVVYLFLAGTFFTLYSNQFSMIQAGRTALQAQQYAEVDANVLQLVDYDDIDDYAHTRQAIDISKIITAAGWEDEISVTPETVVDVAQNTRQRVANIKIYKTGDTLARYMLEVPLSTKGRGIRKGMILAWNGNINNVPSGWHLCDGSNGTPDLRNRFILGAGIRSIGTSGGEESHTLTIAEMPSHNHTISWLGYEYIPSGDAKNPLQTAADLDGYQYGAFGGGLYPSLVTSYAGGNQPHSIMNPYYVLAYIMRVI